MACVLTDTSRGVGRRRAGRVDRCSEALLQSLQMKRRQLLDDEVDASGGRIRRRTWSRLFTASMHSFHCVQEDNCAKYH